MPNLKYYFTVMKQVRPPMADFFTVTLTASVKAERILFGLRAMLKKLSALRLRTQNF
jgi:hypothetical protein